MYVNTYGTAQVKGENEELMKDGDIAKIIAKIIDLRPAAIIKRFGFLVIRELKNLIL